jgi:inorganic triphosphatase YgiF
MATEVESKFRAADRRTLQRLATVDRLGPARLGPASVANEADRYLDTPHGLLAAAGWACRLRTRAGRTIVSLKGTAAVAVGDLSGVHRRPEVEGPATAAVDPATWPPSAARDLLVELARGAVLEQRLRLDQRRTERAVALGGHEVATLSLDEVQVFDREGGSAGWLLVVELEHADGARDREPALAPVADALRSEPGLIPDPLTKLEHATRLIAESRAQAG